MATLNDLPSGERPHIVFFGARNAGKSSLVNAVAGQSLSVVSDVAGTTTDPVRKAMELLPAGPVVLVDTPGIDDEGELGSLRVQQAYKALDSASVAVLVVDSLKGLSSADLGLVDEFQQRRIPYVVVSSKSDLVPGGFDPYAGIVELDEAGVRRARLKVSARDSLGIGELKKTIAKLVDEGCAERKVASDLVSAGDVVVLVIPIDSSAPKGRIILPQQMVIRDLVEAGAVVCAVSPEGLAALLSSLAAPPALVVTDSQVFGRVAPIVPPEVGLTSFSILMSRYRGVLDGQVLAVDALERLGDDDVVLISEGCTHHRQCKDIGTIKLPQWICRLSSASPRFEFTSGRDFPDDLSAYRAVVHCGGCMLNAREMRSRTERARDQQVPFTNYGMTIAKANGVLDRALQPLVERGCVQPGRDEQGISCEMQVPSSC